MTLRWRRLLSKSVRINFGPSERGRSPGGAYGKKCMASALALPVVRKIIERPKFNPPASKRRFTVAELKTKKNEAGVEAFLRRVADPKRREDCFTVLELMEDVSQLEPTMWGTSIVGFGTCQYKYASGRGGT